MSSLEKTGLSRRSMLCGVLVALAVPGGLAACGSEPTPGGTGTTGGTTPGGGTTPAGPPIIAALADVPEGGGLIAGNPANGKPLVLVRTGETVKAFDATCPHQGTAVSPPEGDVITCPNHGSTFNASDGAVTKGPATKGLAEVPVKVEAGQVVPA
ncbi:Rieske (2Fe-2S) protein [Saccharothrix texasensis]|uniref:Cytochrome bc1 complex Rieske iron-sulfur subunit n=1 Tax=Saccharothrix texasensis TaxID=103734 RepID=A0A3N1HG76_9PSEU|nr:Rieske (2Fe-2S) protein [Saccharothrix texasensis]ROP41486.1 nitrite reductase/ring-hydroxylating ferredoxin subunit [Saccharothrix texasensis]